MTSGAAAHEIADEFITQHNGKAKQTAGKKTAAEQIEYTLRAGDDEIIHKTSS